MIIKQKSLRRYLREWCARRGVQYSRRVWLVRKQSAIERETERLRARGVVLRPYQVEAVAELRTKLAAKRVAVTLEREAFGNAPVNVATMPTGAGKFRPPGAHAMDVWDGPGA